MTTPIKVEQVSSFAEQFWARVSVGTPDECWLWQGTQASSDGYGRVSVNGRGRPAHQVAWELKNGQPFPAGKIGCHSCDTPACVNPAHIWPGTHAENIQDCVRKGRHASKPATHCTKGHELTPENRRGVSQQFRCVICHRAAQRAYRRRWREARKKERLAAEANTIAGLRARIGELEAQLAAAEAKTREEDARFVREWNGDTADGNTFLIADELLARIPETDNE